MNSDFQERVVAGFVGCMLSFLVGTLIFGTLIFIFYVLNTIGFVVSTWGTI